MKANRQWMLRLPCVILLIAFCAAYQTQAKAWQRQSEENRAAAAEVEAYNANILAMQAQLAQEREAETAAVQKYADGSYTASAMGFGGQIEVRVTVRQDRMEEISVLKHDGEDAVYFEEATAVIDRILAAQSVEVDAVAGATFSSTGILEAVRSALSQAEEGT